MKRFLVLLALVSILSLTACGASAMRAPRAPAASSAPGMELAVPQAQYGFGGAGGGAPQPAMPPSNDLTKASDGSRGTIVTNSTASQPQTDRLVIQNAELTIIVKDVNARVQSIQDMTKTMGGFIVSVNVFETVASDGVQQVPQAQMVVRVPAVQLDEALGTIKKDAVDVKNETRSGQDVTDQYVDLQSRLKAKQAAETQLLAIMQDAKKTQDVLDVYSQLQQVESDIEVLKGQMKYYEQSAALSAISVNIIAEETVKPLEVGGWKPQGVARDAIQNLIYFWQGFVDFVIRFVLLYLPVLLTIGIPLYLVFLLLRWVLRKTRRPRPPVPVEAAKQ